jgi:hypothetical protein
MHAGRSREGERLDRELPSHCRRERGEGTVSGVQVGGRMGYSRVQQSRCGVYVAI